VDKHESQKPPQEERGGPESGGNLETENSKKERCGYGPRKRRGLVGVRKESKDQRRKGGTS